MNASRRAVLLLALMSPWASGCAGDPSGRTRVTGAGAGPAGGGSSATPTSTSGRAGAPSPRPTAGRFGSRVLNVVAHPDDDLLFLSPDLLRSMDAGSHIRTVYLTAGDAGRARAYWTGRMAGVRAAYAQMAGVTDRWVEVDPGLPGVTAQALVAAPRVSLVFLKLPDGGSGSGYQRYGHASLPLLWRGQIPAVAAVDGSASYTRASLLQALVTVMGAYQPDVVRTQDYLGRFGDGDHNDHHAAAYLTRAASRSHRPPHRLVAYQDYAVQHRPANTTGRLLERKRAAFAAYSHSDPEVFATRLRSAAYRPGFSDWLARQYVLAEE